MFNKTEVSVFLLGNKTEKIFADHPWVKKIDECGYIRIVNKHYAFSIYPYVQSYTYDVFKKVHVSTPERLEFVMCLNMNQEEINAFARQHPHSLFVNFDQSGYTDVETCILDYPNRFNEKLILDSKAKIPILNAAVNSLNIPKDLIGYILQFYCCVDKISRPGTFLFFGQQALPRPDHEIAVHFMLDVNKAIEDTVTNFIDEATNGLNFLVQKFN